MDDATEQEVAFYNNLWELDENQRCKTDKCAGDILATTLYRKFPNFWFKMLSWIGALAALKILDTKIESTAVHWASIISYAITLLYLAERLGTVAGKTIATLVAFEDVSELKRTWIFRVGFLISILILAFVLNPTVTAIANAFVDAEIAVAENP